MWARARPRSRGIPGGAPMKGLQRVARHPLHQHALPVPERAPPQHARHAQGAEVGQGGVDAFQFPDAPWVRTEQTPASRGEGASQGAGGAGGPHHHLLRVRAHQPHVAGVTEISRMQRRRLADGHRKQGLQQHRGVVHGGPPRLRCASGPGPPRQPSLSFHARVRRPYRLRWLVSEYQPPHGHWQAPPSVPLGWHTDGRVRRQ